MTDTSSVFDLLVRELSDDERRDLLDRISGSVRIQPLPVSDGSEDKDLSHDPAEVYRGMGLFRQLWLFLKSVFTGQERYALVQEMMIKDLGRLIVRKAPGILNLKTEHFLTAFRDQIKVLADCCRIFQAPLSRISGGEEGGFLAFLTGMEMETLHRQLLTETDPFAVSTSEPELTEPEVKRRLYLNLEYLLESMNNDLRTRMYSNSRFLQNLKVLANFPFDSMIHSFRPVGDENHVACSFYEIRDQVVKLARVLGSMRFTPSERLFESLHLYGSQRRLSDPEYDLENELKRFIQQSTEAMSGIKEFYSIVPLLQIARYITGNVSLEPAEIPGGEDWFNLLKRFWNERIERLYESYVVSVKKRRIIGELSELIDGTFKPFPGYPARASHSEGSHAASLGALRKFLESVFLPQLVPVLKTLLIDGEFYKDDNRREYDSAFRVLIETEEKIETFATRLSVKGDFGVALSQSERQTSSTVSGETGSDEVITRIDSRAREIITESLRNVKSVGEVLNGVLYGEVGGRYDTIANLGQIGGRSNKEIKRRLDEILRTFNQFYDTLSQLFELEQQAQVRGL